MIKKRQDRFAATWVALLVKRYLSNRASFGLCVFCRVKDHHNLLHYSPLLKKASVRQVVLDKLFPLIRGSHTKFNKIIVTIITIIATKRQENTKTNKERKTKKKQKHQDCSASTVAMLSARHLPVGERPLHQGEPRLLYIYIYIERERERDR